MILIFLGPPGSGKGTQAQYLVNNSGYVHVSTGQLLRKEVLAGGPLADEIESKLNSGKLSISDEIIFQLIKNVISENVDSDLIFDGFPRTQNQALALENILEVGKHKIDLVVDFKVDLAQLLDRVSGRFNCKICGSVYHDVNKRPEVEGVCDSCGSNQFQRRSDDTVDVMKTRVEVYQNETVPVGEYYSQKGILKSVDASMDALKIREVIEEYLKQIGL